MFATRHVVLHWPGTWRAAENILTQGARALQIYAQKRKMEEMRKEIKNYISWHYGPSAWDEVLSIEAQMRKQRKEELYRKEELKKAIIEWTVGILILVTGICLMGFILWIIGKGQGKW